MLQRDQQSHTIPTEEIKVVRYSYEIKGKAANGQTWTVNGYLNTIKQGDFYLAPHMAIKDAFEKLTDGKAVYGQPGVGCNGPYEFTRLLIEKEE